MKGIFHLAIIVLGLVSSISYAQNHKIRFKHYTIDHGLSQNTVLAILEDREGTIWIGTEDGLNKFNGYTFSNFKHQNLDLHSISHNHINDLYEDKAGRIWVATSDGLNIFDKRTERFELLPIPNNNNPFITSIFEDSKGNIWVTTLNGLYQYLPKTHSFEHFPYGNNYRADKIMEDSNGIFWISTDKSLQRFDPVKKEYISLPPPLSANETLHTSYPRSIKEDHLKRIWIGTETAGLFIYDPRRNTLRQYEHEKTNKNNLPINIVRDIFFNKENEVWIGTRNGLSIFNPQNEVFQTFQNDTYDDSSISQNSVRAILKDRAGNIWIGTFGGGLNLVTPSHSTFNYIGAKTIHQPGLSYYMASAVVGAQDGGLWIGTEGGGLNYANPDLSSFQTYALPQTSTNIAANTIKCLLPDGDNLWVGTFKGLSYFDTKTKKLTDIQIPKNRRGIVAMVSIGDDLWLGTNGDGLIRRNRSGHTTIFNNNSRDSNSLSRNNIFDIIKDKNNNLWIATNNGLNYYDHKKFTRYQYDKNNPYSISSNNISTLLIDSKDRLWVGTKGGGLNYLDKSTGRFYALDQNKGLANDAIQSITEDDKGFLWISTNKGLSRITIKGNPPFDESNVEVSNYFVEDGLQSNQFMLNASFKNEKGELFFGGINGMTYFHPDNIQKNLYLPPVILTEFMIRNRPIHQYDENSPLQRAINETQEITLRYDQTFISFQFAALNYINPAKNQYAYKLEGLKNNDDWNYVGNQRMATFTNLDAGTYYFKVKASNNDGVWNDTAKTIKITVLPPWWKTWWAYSIYALIIFSLLYFYYSYSIKTARLQSDLAFEHLIREKEQELYQRKLNFFTNISHEIKTPLTLILAPLEKLLEQNQGNNRIQHQIMLMKRNGDRLIRLINQLLDFRRFESGDIQFRPTEGDMVHFVQEVVLAFEGYATHLGINLKVDSEKKSIRAWFDKDKFEKILYNLLSNALKFTKTDGEIIVRIREHTTENDNKGYVSITVEDNGIGISPDKIDNVFDQFRYYDEEGMNTQGSGIGLAFSKALVELHHGEISVSSTPEDGTQPGKTCFTVKIPLGKAHLRWEDIVEDDHNSEDITEYTFAKNDSSEQESSSHKATMVLSKMEDRPVMLIVEDNKEVMAFLKDHFQDKFQVHTAFDGEEGVNNALELIPDIIISDVMMPKMSGTTLCSTLKTDNRTSHIPIILLTARAPVIYQIEGLETGADDYITKPFNAHVLTARVWNLLEQRQQLRERYKKEVTLEPQSLAITSADEVFLEKVMAYIEANISHDNLNVENLAAEVFMSRTTLYRKIKALTNQTPVDFIRTVKLKRAAQLLKTKSYTVNQIAFMTGFTEVNYFRKCFKEQFNLTPSEYVNKG